MSELLDGFLPTQRLQELHNLLSYPTWLLKALSKLIIRVMNFAGFEIGFRIPESLRSIPPSDWDILVTIEKLKRHGLLQELNRNKSFPDDPNLYRYQAKSFGLAVGNGAGFDFFSSGRALRAAIGELVERYALLHFQPTRVERRSYAAQKRRTFDLNQLAGISPIDRQKSEKLIFSDESIFEWVTAWSLPNNSAKQVPLQLIRLLQDRSVESKVEPLLRPVVTTGAAAHISLEQAQLGGTYELLERDALMITWMNRLKPKRIKLESVSSDRIQELHKKFIRYRLELRCLLLPTDFSVHVVVAIIIDTTNIGPHMVVASSAGTNLIEVLEKAITEAHACRLYLRFMLKSQEVKSSPSHNTQTSIKLTRVGRLKYWSDPHNFQKAQFLFEGDEILFNECPQYESGNLSVHRQLEALVSHFRKLNIELLCVELLPRHLQKALGHTAVMMFSPQLQPMHLDETLPYNWGARLDSVPITLGFQPLKEKNGDPHPFP